MNASAAKDLVVKVTVKLDGDWLSLGLTACVITVRTSKVGSAVACALTTLGGGTVEDVVGPIRE